MAEKKLFVFDIDGTLLDDNKNLPESTRNAVTSLMEHHEVAIATGRNRTMAMEVIKDLGVNNYIVCNGAAAYYQNDSIYTNSLDKEELNQLINMADENGHQMIYETVDNLRRRSSEPNSRMVNGMHHVGFPVPDFDKDYYKSQSLVQCLIFYTKEEAELYENNKFSQFRFVRWHDAGVDVLPADGSKYETITRLAQHIGVDNQNIIAFGDGFNDIEMIRHVGTGVAMGNAEDEVKRVANIVTSKNGEDGIYNALKNMAFI
ncbi:Cof-type HAD-IIB family hydrolase [Alkalibacterium sp.]|nr:MAG: Cof-type HAD-IIB family hydrolase [Alkalibacterium sp.]